MLEIDIATDWEEANRISTSLPKALFLIGVICCKLVLSKKSEAISSEGIDCFHSS